MSTTTTRLPNPSSVVYVCTACDHWQVDVPPSVVRRHYRSDALAVFRDVTQLQACHVLDECPAGTGGRIKVAGEWIDRPLMRDGKQSDGAAAAYPLPRWWVWR